MSIKNQNILRSILKIGLVTLWLIFLLFLAKKYYISPLPNIKPNLSSLEREIRVGERWMGIYMKDTKVGYSVTFTEKEGDNLRIIDKTFMQFNVMGEDKKIKTLTKCITDKDYTLKYFNFNLTSNEMQFEVEGEVVGKEIQLTLKSMGEEKKENIKVKEIPCIWTNLIPYVSIRGLEVGKRYSVSLFDPSVLSTTDIIIEIEGYETMNYHQEEVKVARLKHLFKNIEVKSWVTSNGEILKEESPLGFIILRESQSEALSSNWNKDTKLDITAATSIPTNIELENPGNVKYMKARLYGISIQDFQLNDERQKIEGDTIEIFQEDLTHEETYPRYKLPYQEELYKEFIEPTNFIQSNDPRIIRTAQNIIKDEKEPIKAAKSLLTWVYENIEKASALTIPNAVSVLETKRGDCNEHTALYAALARAVGIPTKINVGIVTLGKNFFYHAWPSVYLGKWVSIDPTLNQFPSDATHVKFIEGELDKQVDMIKVIGKLKVEILEYR